MEQIVSVQNVKDEDVNEQVSSLMNKISRSTFFTVFEPIPWKLSLELLHAQVEVAEFRWNECWCTKCLIFVLAKKCNGEVLIVLCLKIIEKKAVMRCYE